MKTKNYTLLILFFIGSQLMQAGNGFKFASVPFTNFTIDQAYLTANPGAWDSIVVEGSGTPNSRTITIDLNGGTLPMTFKTGFLLARKGGRFIIKNSTIESNHIRKLWKGIILQNYNKFEQRTSLEMDNVKLNYAYDAIYTGIVDLLYEPASNLDVKALSGALLKIKNCKFYNCRTSITTGYFEGYNASRIEKSEFKWDKFFDTSYFLPGNIVDFVMATTLDSQNYRAHVLIVGNQGVKLIGNQYLCFRPWQDWGVYTLNGFLHSDFVNPRRKGVGICVVNSKVYIGASGPCVDYDDRGSTCHKCSGGDNLFEGLGTGIYITNTKAMSKYQQSCDILDTKFRNNTFGVQGGFTGGLWCFGSSSFPVWNIHVENCDFNTDNGYYYHDLIYTKNACDIIFENAADYRIIRNRFSKMYGDPAGQNLTDQTCSSFFGAHYSANIYILNCTQASGNHPQIAPSNTIYKNFFKNRPFVRCTDKFTSITFDGNNYMPDNYANTGAQIDCNIFDNGKSLDGTSYTSIHDIFFRLDRPNSPANFSNVFVGRPGKPTYNKFSYQPICGSVFTEDTFDIGFEPSPGPGYPAWSNQNGAINWYYQNNTSKLPADKAPSCVYNGIGNINLVGNDFSNPNDLPCYPQAYSNFCPSYDRPGETTPYDPNNSQYDPVNYNPYNLPTEALSGNQMSGVYLIPGGHWNINTEPLYVEYIFPADVHYLQLQVFSSTGTLISDIVIPKELFNPQHKFDLTNYLRSKLGPGTYYFFFRNSNGEWQTLILIVQ